MQTAQVFCVVCGVEIPKNEYETGDPRICEKCWKCPHCGVGVDYKDIDGKLRQGLVMEDTYVNCSSCEKGWVAKNFEKAVLRAKHLNPVKCSCCNGKGWVFEKCQST